MSLAGSVLGVLLNEVSPQWLVLGTIVLAMGYASYKSVRKGLALRRHERHRAAAPVEAKAGGGLLQAWPPSIGSLNAEAAAELQPVGADASEAQPLLLQNYRSAGELARGKLHARELSFPWQDLAMTLAELVGLVAINLVLRLHGGGQVRHAGVLGRNCGAVCVPAAVRGSEYALCGPQVPPEARRQLRFCAGRHPVHVTAALPLPTAMYDGGGGGEEEGRALSLLLTPALCAFL